MEKVEETKKCSHQGHEFYSEYPKSNVPINLFVKGDRILKQCIDCRNYKNRKRKEKREEKLSDYVPNPMFKKCMSYNHHLTSIYPIYKVPIDLFRKTERNDVFYESCINCRKYDNEKNSKRIERMKLSVIKDINFLCRSCNKIKNNSERAINIDGSISETCDLCKDYNYDKLDYLKNTFKELRLEYMLKHETSCQKCNLIFLKPENNFSGVTELKIHVRNNKKYVIYFNVEYEVKNFIKNFVDILELRIIEFDHLTEKEQRERNILSPDQPFEDKINCVYSMKSKEAMIAEAKKCQILCRKCHTKVTKERRGISNTPTFNKLSKSCYVNNIKINNGCAICHFKNEEPELFDMDHLDPRLKIANVSVLVDKPKYTLEDVKNECSKCRVLCKHCHVIQTDIQRQTV